MGTAHQNPRTLILNHWWAMPTYTYSMFIYDHLLSFEQHIHYLPDSKLVRSYLFKITKYKRLENKLNHDASYYRFLIEQTSEGILLAELNSKNILDANASYCKLTGYELDEIKQLNLYQIVAIER